MRIRHSQTARCNRISNSILHWKMDVITYPCWDELIDVSKGDHWWSILHNIYTQFYCDLFVVVVISVMRRFTRVPFTLILYCFVFSMGLLPDKSNCGCACAGNTGNVFPATAGKRFRHASRHVRDARAVMHAGIAYPRFPGIPGACATLNFTYLVRGPLGKRMIAFVPVKKLWRLSVNRPSYCNHQKAKWSRDRLHISRDMHILTTLACRHIGHFLDQYN